MSKHPMVKDPAFTHDGKIKRFYLKNIATEKCSVCQQKGKRILPMRMCEYCYGTICTSCWDLKGQTWHHAQDRDIDDNDGDNAIIVPGAGSAESSGPAGEQTAAGLPKDDAKSEETTSDQHISSTTQTSSEAPVTSLPETQPNIPHTVMGPPESKELSAKAKGKQRAEAPSDEPEPKHRASHASSSSLTSVDSDFDCGPAPWLPPQQRRTRPRRTVVEEELSDDEPERASLRRQARERTRVAMEEMSEDDAIRIAMISSPHDRQQQLLGESSRMASNSALAAGIAGPSSTNPRRSVCLGTPAVPASPVDAAAATAPAQRRPTLSGIRHEPRTANRVSFALPPDDSSSPPPASTPSPAKRKPTLPPSSKKGPKRQKIYDPNNVPEKPVPAPTGMGSQYDFIHRQYEQAGLQVQVTGPLYRDPATGLFWTERDPVNRGFTESALRGTPPIPGVMSSGITEARAQNTAAGRGELLPRDRLVRAVERRVAAHNAALPRLERQEGASTGRDVTASTGEHRVEAPSSARQENPPSTGEEQQSEVHTPSAAVSARSIPAPRPGGYAQQPTNTLEHLSTTQPTTSTPRSEPDPHHASPAPPQPTPIPNPYTYLNLAYDTLEDHISASTSAQDIIIQALSVPPTDPVALNNRLLHLERTAARLSREANVHWERVQALIAGARRDNDISLQRHRIQAAAANRRTEEMRVVRPYISPYGPREIPAMATTPAPPRHDDAQPLNSIFQPNAVDLSSQPPSAPGYPGTSVPPSSALLQSTSQQSTAPHHSRSIFALNAIDLQSPHAASQTQQIAPSVAIQAPVSAELEAEVRAEAEAEVEDAFDFELETGDEVEMISEAELDLHDPARQG